ncbi:MAG: hypothetical protein WCI43_08340, partial [Candidatus Firestonebacteria bacterium]
MATMKKIYELAKEIGQKPQDIIMFLNSSGFPGFKSELNPINSIVADFVYEKFTGKPAPKKEEKKIVRPPVAKPEVVVSAPVKPAVPLIKKEAPSTQEKPVLKKKETEEQTVDSGTPKTSLKTPVKVGSHKVAPAVVQAKAGAGKPKQQELAPAQKLADALAKKAVPKQVQPAATTGKKPEPVRVGRH